MSFTRWLSHRLGLAPRPASRRKTPAARPIFRPTLEAMEDRWVPSTLHVTSSADLVTQHGTLRWAVANAQSGDTILVDKHVERTGITLTHGELVLGQDVTIETQGTTPVTISGGHTSRIFEVASGAHVTLSNLTITGGNGLADNPAGTASQDGYGGGILVDAGAALAVSGSALSGNSATYGGGIFNEGTATVSANTLSGNAASAGGGIANFFGGTLTVSGSTLSGNAARFSGGGVYNLQGTLMVSGSTLSGNSASGGGGGGVYNLQGTLMVSGSTLSGNSATYGGGIFVYTGTATISGSALSGNSATYGGGIYNEGTMTVSGSALSGNSATYGGGIFNEGTMTVSGSTLSGNTATYDGGGISNGGTLTVQGFSSITGNTAPPDLGADVYNLGVLYLDSTSMIGILDGNPAVPI